MLPSSRFVRSVFLVDVMVSSIIAAKASPTWLDKTLEANLVASSFSSFLKERVGEILELLTIDELNTLGWKE